jgi:hypothetical protein
MMYFLRLADLFAIRGWIFQLLEIVGVLDLENENPALAVGFAVDEARIWFERFVYFDNSSLYGA